MDDCIDVFVSNDLDCFEEEFSVKPSLLMNFNYHRFQNPNINLNSNLRVNLGVHMSIPEYNKGVIYSSIKMAMEFDSKKYSNMNIIPKLSRKQKSYNEYLKKVRPFFRSLQLLSGHKSSSLKIHHSNIPLCTIPEYMEFMKNTHPNYFYKFIEQNSNQFKLALLYGYPIICGFDKDNIVVVVGFDKNSFIVKKPVNGDVSEIPQEELFEFIFDACIVYSLLGCDREINLGFL